MRILLAGSDGPLLRILAARFSQADQAVALLTGPARLEIPAELSDEQLAPLGLVQAGGK